MSGVDFCTCNEYGCRWHPSNHDEGCTPCIAKNLKNNEVPGCIWHKVRDDLSDVEEFTIENFVRVAGKTLNKR